MIGSIRWNFIVAGISFICTFLFSIANNIWLTTLLRSIYSFLILFALVFLFRWIFGTVVGLNRFISAEDEASGDADADESHKGTALDLTTPDEGDSIHQLLKEKLDPGTTAEDPGFSPLNPPKLTTKADLEPEDLARALRQMSEE